MGHDPMTDQQQQATPDPFDRIEAEADSYEAEQGAAEPSAQPMAGPDDGPATADFLEQLLGPTFQVVAPAWNVQPSEVRALSDAYAGVLDKWFPEGAAAAVGPEFAAAMTTLAVFGPRLGTPRHPPKKKGQGGHEKGEGGDDKPRQAQPDLSPLQEQMANIDDPTAGERRG